MMLSQNAPKKNLQDSTTPFFRASSASISLRFHCRQGTDIPWFAALALADDIPDRVSSPIFQYCLIKSASVLLGIPVPRKETHQNVV